MMNLVPVGFLKLPDISNIDKNPTDPYEFATVGRLHSAKFENIFEYITDNSDINLRSELEGHRLQNVLSSMKKNELADFCRHVLYANKKNPGWHTVDVDSLIVKIDKNHVPSWKLPDFKFDKGFREVFSTIIKWDFEPHIEPLVKEFIETNDISSLNKNELLNKMSSEFHYWSFKELWLFYSSLVEYYNSNIEVEGTRKYSPLITTITNLFTEHLDNPNYNLYQKVALSLIFTEVYVNLGKDAVSRADELVDKRWREVEKLSQQEITSFRYLFGAGYSIIGYHVFNSQTDFIIRRRLLGRLISNFIQPKEVNIKTWFRFLIEGDLHPLVLNYIFIGYSHIIPILKSHSSEFPVGKTRSDLLNQIGEISLTLQKTIFDYLSMYYNLPSLNEITAKQYFQYFERIKIQNEVKKGIEQILVSTTQHIVHLGIEEYDSKYQQKLVDLSKEMIVRLYGEDKAIIFDLDMNLRLGTYPFKQIHEKIDKETEETLSIILSTTFENEIIKVISTLMDYLMRSIQQTGVLDIDSYEVLLFFAGEWLQFFLSSDQLYNEALMVVAPIISICFVQIARGYFERNMKEKAFLTYINMYYFVELFMDEIKQSSTWRTKDVGGSKDREDITNRFNQMISDWKFQELLDVKNIKKIVVNIELSLKQTSSDSSSLSGMLEDDVIFGYLDLTKGLESFIEQEVSSDKEETMSDQLYNSELYKKSVAASYYRFERLGNIAKVNSERELPFPIIRNVHEISSAIRMFPLQLSSISPSLDRDSKLYQSFTNIFTFDKEN